MKRSIIDIENAESSDLAAVFAGWMGHSATPAPDMQSVQVLLKSCSVNGTRSNIGIEYAENSGLAEAFTGEIGSAASSLPRM